MTEITFLLMFQTGISRVIYNKFYLMS